MQIVLFEITLFRIELGEDISNLPNKSTDIYDIKEESESKGKSDLWCIARFSTICTI